MADEQSRLVYSTDKIVSRKDKAYKNAQGHATDKAKRRNIIVRLDRKARGGKSVTLIEGLPVTPVEKEAFLKELKASLGTGGTLKGMSLEIQGDHCDAVIKALERRGYKPKRSGG